MPEKVVGEIGQEFTPNKPSILKSLFVVTVTCVQVPILSRYICCTKTPRMRRVLTKSTYVTIFRPLKNGSRLWKVPCKSKKRYEQVDVHMLTRREPSRQ